jgi:hypothetical protein
VDTTEDDVDFDVDVEWKADDGLCGSLLATNNSFDHFQTGWWRRDDGVSTESFLLLVVWKTTEQAAEEAGDSWQDLSVFERSLAYSPTDLLHAQ